MFTLSLVFVPTNQASFKLFSFLGLGNQDQEAFAAGPTSRFTSTSSMSKVSGLSFDGKTSSTNPYTAERLARSRMLLEQRERNRKNGVGENGEDLTLGSDFCLLVAASSSSASSATIASLKENVENFSDSSSWNCHKCKHTNPPDRVRCAGKRSDRGSSCLALRDGKLPVKIAVKDQKRKRGKENHFHSSNGGGIVNAKRTRQGGSVPVLTLRTANNSDANNVKHLNPALQALLPLQFRSRQGGLVVNAGDNAVETICKKFGLANGKHQKPKDQRQALVALHVQFGFDVVTNIFLPGKVPGVVQQKMVVFAPPGTKMTEEAFGKLNGTAGVDEGTVHSLCKRQDCFSLSKEGNGNASCFCAAHTVEV